MPLDLTLFAAALANRQPRLSRRSVAGMVPRQPSIGTRFLNDLRADVAAQRLAGVALPLAPLARAWCDANYPTSPDRKTPWATLESQVRVAAKAGALPLDVVIISAKDAAAVGLPSVALIVVSAGGEAAGVVATAALDQAVGAQAAARARRDGAG